jgi:hypothetical protein
VQHNYAAEHRGATGELHSAQPLAARAEADLAAAAGTVTGRGRIAGFESVALHLALPAIVVPPSASRSSPAGWP